MNLFARINRRYRINRAVRELSALNNEILRDIGIERGDITGMVEHLIDQESIRTEPVNTFARVRTHNDYNLTGGVTA